MLVCRRQPGGFLDIPIINVIVSEIYIMVIVEAKKVILYCRTQTGMCNVNSRENRTSN